MLDDIAYKLKFFEWSKNQDGTNYGIGRRCKSALFFLEHAEGVKRKDVAEFYSLYDAEITRLKLDRTAISNFISFCSPRKAPIRQKKDELLIKSDRGTYKKEEYINNFINYLRAGNDYSEHTVAIHITGIRNFFRYSSEFSQEQCRRYIATLQESKLKPSTIRLRILTLEKYGKFIGKPVIINKPKMERVLNVENIPRREEYERLLDYLQSQPDKRWYWMIRLLGSTGMRVSELLQTTWDNVLSGEYETHGKGNKYRRIIFPKSLIADAKQYVKETGVTGPVAVTRFGEPMTQRCLCGQMKRWSEPVKIAKEKLHPHAFRHFFAKMYLSRDNNIVHLADILGHNNLETTRIYTKRTKNEQTRDFNRVVKW